MNVFVLFVQINSLLNKHILILGDFNVSVYGRGVCLDDCDRFCKEGISHLPECAQYTVRKRYSKLSE